MITSIWEPPQATSPATAAVPDFTRGRKSQNESAHSLGGTSVLRIKRCQALNEVIGRPKNLSVPLPAVIARCIAGISHFFRALHFAQCSPILSWLLRYNGKMGSTRTVKVKGVGQTGCGVINTFDNIAL